MTTESHHTFLLVILVEVVGVWLSICFGSFLHRVHLTRIIPESASTILLGLLIGTIIKYASTSSDLADEVGFEATFFQFVLLPIIIFESGFSLRKRYFFNQLTSILMFSVVGTVISTFVIGGIVYGVGYIASNTSSSSSSSPSIYIPWPQAFAFASLLSATDPVATLAVFGSLKVDPVLNALVYGESVVNDAVSIVLFSTFLQFIGTDGLPDMTSSFTSVGRFLGVLLGSAVLGFVLGSVVTPTIRIAHLGWTPSCCKLRGTKKKTKTKNIVIAGSRRSGEAAAAAASAAEEDEAEREQGDLDDQYQHQHQQHPDAFAITISLILFCYASFFIAELASLSGIVAALFAGIHANHYTRKIVPDDAKLFSSGLFKSLASLADCAVFFTIGLDVATSSTTGLLFLYDIRFISWTIFACLVSRAVNVFPLSALLNRYRTHPIPASHQLQMWHAGLRGAIAYASALAFEAGDEAEGGGQGTGKEEAGASAANGTSAFIAANIRGCTAVTVLFTVFTMAPTTVPLLNRLKISYGEEQAVEGERSSGGSGGEQKPLSRAEKEGTVQKMVRKIDVFLRQILSGLPPPPPPAPPITPITPITTTQSITTTTMGGREEGAGASLSLPFRSKTFEGTPLLSKK